MSKHMVNKQILEIVKHYPEGINAVILLTLAREYMRRSKAGEGTAWEEIEKWIEACDDLIGPEPNTPSE